MRLCVIGAGIIGSAIAYELSKASNAEVTVVDGSYPGSGATAASFSWVNANAKEPVPYFHLNAAGHAEYERLCREFGTDEWLNRSGCLITTPTDDEAELRVSRAVALGYEARVVPSDKVMDDIEPSLKLRRGRKVAYFPSEAWLDVDRLVNLLLHGVSENGGLSHFGQRVVGIERVSGAWQVRLHDGTSVTADVVVNAAGAGADVIASMVGRRLSLSPTLGITMRVEAPACPLRTIVRNINVDARPDGGGIVRLHAHSIDQRIARGGEDRNNIAAEFMRRAQNLFVGLEDAHVLDTRIARRPYPEDGLSWVGRVDGIDGYYECVTHSGVTLGALLGRLVSLDLLEDRREPLLTPFAPDRDVRSVVQ